MEHWWIGWVLALSTLFGPGDGSAHCFALGTLDLARTRAFVNADPRALDDVYLAGSEAGEVDRSILADYTARGLRLEGMLLVRESCEVREVGPERVELGVVDRLGRTAVIDGAGRRRELPRDEPTARVVVLRLVDDAWRIESVR